MLNFCAFFIILYKFADLIGMLSSYNILIRTVNIEDPLDLKRNVFHALNNNKMTAFITFLRKLKHLCKIQYIHRKYVYSKIGQKSIINDITKPVFTMFNYNYINAKIKT